MDSQLTLRARSSAKAFKHTGNVNAACTACGRVSNCNRLGSKKCAAKFVARTEFRLCSVSAYPYAYRALRQINCRAGRKVAVCQDLIKCYARKDGHIDALTVLNTLPENAGFPEAHRHPLPR